MSQRSSFLAGNNGFERIPDMQSYNQHGGYGGGDIGGDATVSIPLTQVHTNKSGNRKVTGLSEKTESYPLKQGGRRKAHQDLRGSDIEGVNSMGRLYRKVLRSSIIVRYFLYIIPVGAILAIPIIIGAVVTNPAPPGIGNVRIVWIFAWALTMWVALWAAKLFSKTLPYIFEFLCGIVSPGTRKYSTVIRSLEIPISLVFWALASLATFRPILTNNASPYTFNRATDPTAAAKLAYADNWITIVIRILAAFLACAGIYLAEKTIIQLISVSYHRMQYDMKIKESKQQVHVLSMLYDASIAQFPAFCPEFLDEDYLINDSPEFGGSRKGHARSGSATPMKILAHVNRFGDRITSAFGNIAQEVTGKEVFNPTSAHSIVVAALEKTRSSEALAKRIWMSLVAEGKEALYQEDLIEVLIDEPTSVAIESFDILDNDKNGDVTLDEMILKVCEVGRSRKAIARSLHDVDQAIGVLDNLLLSAVLLICVFVFIAFLNTSFVTTLATAGTALLSLSFVFSVTAQEVLGSCIFLFVKHPFDVGDVVVVNTQKLIVERISLLYTVFKNAASHTTTQCPNVVLNAQWIDNITRSKSMRESLNIDVSFDTTLEDVELLRREMEMFVRGEDNSRDFEPDVEIELQGVGSMDKLSLAIDIKHKSNWSNGAVTAARRSKFMCALVLALRKVPIDGPGGGGAVLGSADQPTYSVSVTDHEAAEARAAFEKAKAEKHIKSTKFPSESTTDVGVSTAYQNSGNESSLSRQRSLGPASETQALANLTTRAPAQDSNHEWQTSSNERTTSVRRPGHPGPPLSPVGEARSQEVEAAYSLNRTSTHGRRRQSEVSRDSNGSALRPPRVDEPMPGLTSPSYQQFTNTSHSGNAYAAGHQSQAVNQSPNLNQNPGSTQSPVSPLVSRSGDGFIAGQYNPYVQTMPIYDQPPSQAPEDRSNSTRNIPTSPLPRTPGSAALSGRPHELEGHEKSANA